MPSNPYKHSIILCIHRAQIPLTTTKMPPFLFQKGSKP